jgi:osmotically-inducible protein OsmY
LDGAGIGVSVDGGVATLTGRAASPAERILAERAVRRVAGVRDVANRIEVAVPAGPRTDAALAEEVHRALEWDLWVPRRRVRAFAREGWVTLEGEVNSRCQKEAAVRDASRVPGVRGVTDAITIRPTPAPADVRARIGGVLAGPDAAGAIRVETFPGAVLLRGIVRSSVEREKAERAARTAPGVSEVVNGLEVREAPPVGA